MGRGTLTADEWRSEVTPGQEWVWDNAILYHVTGGRLYGTSAERDSDFDYVGVTIPPVDYWLGTKRFEQWQCRRVVEGVVHEITVYGLAKFFALSAGCNPNIIESWFVQRSSRAMLRSPREDVWWDEVLPHRASFISLKAFHTFSGYACAQIHKLRVKRENQSGRMDLAAKFGFDTKFAMHAFRLFYEGMDLLKTGLLEFPLPRLSELLDIRHGRAYGPDDLDRLIADLEGQDGLLKQVYAGSTLPSRPDAEAINALQKCVVTKFLCL